MGFLLVVEGDGQIILGLQFTGLEGRHMGFMRFWPFDSLLFGSVLAWSSLRVVVHLQWSQIVSWCVLLWFFCCCWNSTLKIKVSYHLADAILPVSKSHKLSLGVSSL